MEYIMYAGRGRRARRLRQGAAREQEREKKRQQLPGPRRIQAGEDPCPGFLETILGLVDIPDIAKNEREERCPVFFDQPFERSGIVPHAPGVQEHRIFVLPGNLFHPTTTNAPPAGLFSRSPEIRPSIRPPGKGKTANALCRMHGNAFVRGRLEVLGG